MKKITKILLGILTGVMLMGMTALAAEYTVTDTDAVLWTNGNTVVQSDARTDAPVALPPMEIGTPVHITGVTSNGYWRVEIDGATYFIVSEGLGDTIETDEYIRKYYAQLVIQNIKGITIKVDYTEWNKVTTSVKMAYTATNNTPYVLDVKARDAYIYDKYTKENAGSKSSAFVSECIRLNEQEVDTVGIAPGTSMSGYQYYHIYDNDCYTSKDKQLSVTFSIRKNEDTHGYTTDSIRFERIYFYDYRTANIRVEGTDKIRSSVGFKDVQ